MPEFVVEENGVFTVVAESVRGAVPIAEFIAELAKDESLEGIIPEPTEPAKQEEPDLVGLHTYQSLYDMAKQYNIKLRSKMNEAELIEALLLAGADLTKEK